MAEGHKTGGFMRSGQQAAASANATEIGYIERKNRQADEPDKKVLKKWVKKRLDSQQEVLIECITGEIYRYLIGNYQPKIRTSDVNTILSEFIPYRSFRDIMEDPKWRNNAKRFKDGFIANLDGFMLVLFSAITLEENDLSDMNYGLATRRGGVDVQKKLRQTENGDMEIDEPPEPDNRRPGILWGHYPAPPEPVVPTEDAEYYGFIKIDHGQTINSMRIAESATWESKQKHIKFDRKEIAKLGPWSRAEIKYYPPSSDRDQEQVGGVSVDRRRKRDRKTIFTAMKGRTYVIDPYFIDRVLFHFLCGFIDKDYIENLHYQPSTLPLFDGRLLSLFNRDDQCWYKQRPHYARGQQSYASVWNTNYFEKGAMYSDMWDRFEECKYVAIAKIVFTDSKVYEQIARNATDITSLTAKQQEIRNKVRMNIEALYAAISTDLDFCVYCHDNQQTIRETIQGSYQRMSRKTQGEEDSARYAGALRPVGQPVDETRLEAIVKIGGHYSAEPMRKAANDFIVDVYDRIQNTDWKTGVGGGKKIPVKPRNEPGGRLQIVTVPDHVAEMAISCAYYDFSPRYRLFRTLQDLSYFARHANQKRGFFRKDSTQEFYNHVLTGLATIGDNIVDLTNQQKRALRYFSAYYETAGRERFVELTTLEFQL